MASSALLSSPVRNPLSSHLPPVFLAATLTLLPLHFAGSGRFGFQWGGGGGCRRRRPVRGRAVVARPTGVRWPPRWPSAVHRTLPRLTPKRGHPSETDPTRHPATSGCEAAAGHAELGPRDGPGWPRRPNGEGLGGSHRHRFPGTESVYLTKQGRSLWSFLSSKRKVGAKGAQGRPNQNGIGNKQKSKSWLPLIAVSASLWWATSTQGTARWNRAICPEVLGRHLSFPRDAIRPTDHQFRFPAGPRICRKLLTP